MPRWLLLALFLFGCTLTVPAFVWAGSTSWRQALQAWWFFVRYLLVLMIPAGIAALYFWLV